MKKLPLTFMILGLVSLAGLLLSCTTPPPAAPAPPQPPAVEKKVPPLPEAEYVRAKELKGKVEKYQLGALVPEAFQSAEKSFQEGEAAYKQDNEKAKSSLDQAIAAYRQVIEKGFPLLADRKKAETEAVKDQADSIKANVAVKEDYDKAKALYDQALQERKAGAFEKALELLAQAKDLFADAYAKAKAKKDRAEESLRASQEGLKQVEAQAAEAEKELQQAGTP